MLFILFIFCLSSMSTRNYGPSATRTAKSCSCVSLCPIETPLRAWRISGPLKSKVFLENVFPLSLWPPRRTPARTWGETSAPKRGREWPKRSGPSVTWSVPARTNKVYTECLRTLCSPRSNRGREWGTSSAEYWDAELSDMWQFLVHFLDVHPMRPFQNAHCRNTLPAPVKDDSGLPG